MGSSDAAAPPPSEDKSETATNAADLSAPQKSSEANPDTEPKAEQLETVSRQLSSCEQHLMKLENCLETIQREKEEQSQADKKAIEQLTSCEALLTTSVRQVHDALTSCENRIDELAGER